MKGIQFRRSGEWLLGLVLVAGLVGCAGGRARSLPVGMHGYARYHSASPAPFPGDAASAGAGGTVALGLLEADAFEQLLLRAGLEDLDELPVRRNPFTPEDAAEVLNRLMEKPVTPGTYPPRMAVGFLLREVLEGGEVSREELLHRMVRGDRHGRALEVS